MKQIRIAICLFLCMLFTGCVSSRVIKIEQPLTPFERPYYTVLSPQGEDWRFVETDSTGQHVLTFFLPVRTRPHTVYAIVKEIPSFAKFDSPDEFLSFFQKSQTIGYDAKRFTTIMEESKLDDKYGKLSISYYFKAEDHGAVYSGEAPFLIMETLGYYFVHPYAKNLIVSVFYSERGTAEQMDKSFMERAKAFVGGLRVKEQ